MRVVLDTNILVSALITKGTPPDILYQASLYGEFQIAITMAQIADVKDVIATR